MKVLEKYELKKDNVAGFVTIIEDPKDFVMHYKLEIPKFEPATLAYLDEIKTKLLQIVSIKPAEAIDPKISMILKQRFLEKAKELIKSSKMKYVYRRALDDYVSEVLLLE